MTNDDELLVKILKLSHERVMDGKSFSQEEAERYLDQRLYELSPKIQEIMRMPIVGSIDADDINAEKERMSYYKEKYSL